MKSQAQLNNDLIQAVEKNKPEEVKALIAEGANVLIWWSI